MSLIAIAAQQIFTPMDVIDDGLLVIEDGSIRAVGTRQALSVPRGTRFIDLGNKIVTPGFIDIHIHGGGGHDVMEATKEALETLARLIMRHGTTSFIPTTVTASVPTLVKSLEGLGSLIHSWENSARSGAELLAEPLGIHLEGPFISAARRGVHPAEYLQEPSAALFREFCEAAAGTIRIATLAPELDGAMELQAIAIRSGVKVALGHSDATFEEAEKAIEAGASYAVHTFNAMRPFAQRDTGILGAVLTDDRLQAEVIADGVHVSSPALRLLVRAKGDSNIVLVTDAISATGMGPGSYHLGETEIMVAEEQPGMLVCRNAEGKLAGSVLTQDHAIRNMVAFTGVSLCGAVRMATWNPARLLGIQDRKGCLQPGADADLALMQPDGTVLGTMARGISNFL